MKTTNHIWQDRQVKINSHVWSEKRTKPKHILQCTCTELTHAVPHHEGNGPYSLRGDKTREKKRNQHLSEASG